MTAAPDVTNSGIMTAAPDMTNVTLDDILECSKSLYKERNFRFSYHLVCCLAFSVRQKCTFHHAFGIIVFSKNY